MGSKRGGSVLEAPEEGYVPEQDWQEVGPAPAGAHQRASVGALGGVVPAAEADGAEEAYVPQRGSFRLRLRGGVPRSVAGRIVAGAVVLGTLGVLAAGVLALRSFLLHDPMFLMTTSADIQITGNDHLTRAQALSVFGGDLERNIFRMPLPERRADLERLPWVAHATVMRLLPNRVRVAVTERTPVAFVRQGARIGLVDGAGVLLDMPADAAGDPNYSFPVLTGLAAEDTPEVRAARMEVYRRFMAELDAPGAGGSGKLSSAISEVDVANPEDVKAVVTHAGNDILVHFGDEHFLDRYRAYEAHLAEWRTQYPKLASADMRYERQVVLEMQPGAGVPVNHDAANSGPTATLAGGGTKLPAAVSKTPAAGIKATPVRSATAAKPVMKEAAKPGVVAGKKAGGNAKMFAALAAAHRAETAKKSAGGHTAP